MFEAMIWPRVEVSARHLFQRSVEEMRSRCAVDQKVGPNSDPGYTLPENKIETNASRWPASLVRVCLVKVRDQKGNQDVSPMNQRPPLRIIGPDPAKEDWKSQGVSGVKVLVNFHRS